VKVFHDFLHLHISKIPFKRLAGSEWTKVISAKLSNLMKFIIGDNDIKIIRIIPYELKRNIKKSKIRRLEQVKSTHIQKLYFDKN